MANLQLILCIFFIYFLMKKFFYGFSYESIDSKPVKSVLHIVWHHLNALQCLSLIVNKKTKALKSNISYLI